MQILNIQLSITTKLVANITNIMAPLAAPFELSYTILKSLRQKIFNYTTTFITLPY